MQSFTVEGHYDSKSLHGVSSAEERVISGKGRHFEFYLELWGLEREHVNALDSLPHVGNVTASTLGISASPHQAGAAPPPCKGLRRTEWRSFPSPWPQSTAHPQGRCLVFLYHLPLVTKHPLEAPDGLLTKEILPRLAIKWEVSSHQAHLQGKPQSHKMTII